MKYKLTLNGRVYEVEVESADPIPMQEFQFYAPTSAAPGSESVPSVASTAVSFDTGDGERMESPMPGRILKVNVVPGQTIKEGDVLVVLEAMKMENEIMAPRNGTVTQVLVSKGSAVEAGAPLIFIG